MMRALKIKGRAGACGLKLFKTLMEPAWKLIDKSKFVLGQAHALIVEAEKVSLRE